MDGRAYKVAVVVVILDEFRAWSIIDWDDSLHWCELYNPARYPAVLLLEGRESEVTVLEKFRTWSDNDWDESLHWYELCNTAKYPAASSVVIGWQGVRSYCIGQIRMIVKHWFRKGPCSIQPMIIIIEWLGEKSCPHSWLKGRSWWPLHRQWIPISCFSNHLLYSSWEIGRVKLLWIA